MSSQQTVRITTTSSSTSGALVVNTGYLKTLPGLLKIAQFVIIDFQFEIDISIGHTIWWVPMQNQKGSSNFLIIFRIFEDFGLNYCGNNFISFQWSSLFATIRSILLFDGCYIFHLYNDFVDFVSVLMEHGRNHFEDNLRKLNKIWIFFSDQWIEMIAILFFSLLFFFLSISQRSFKFQKELLYHSVAAILILIASIILLVVLNDDQPRYYRSVYKQLMTASVSIKWRQFRIKWKIKQKKKSVIFLSRRLLVPSMVFYTWSVHIWRKKHIREFNLGKSKTTIQS